MAATLSARLWTWGGSVGGSLAELIGRDAALALL